MVLKDLSSKPLIIAVLVGISIAAIALSIFASYQVKLAAMDAQTKTLARVVEVASNEVISELFVTTSELAQSIQKVKAVRKLIKKGKKAPLNNAQKSELAAELSQQFRQRYVTAGIIDLVKVRAYDKKLRFLGASKDGLENFPTTLPQSIDDQASKREKADRFKPLGMLWQSDKTAYYSLLYPVGGLSLAGYIEVVVAPAHNLKTIDLVLGAPLTIRSLDQQELYQSNNWANISDAILEIDYTLKLPNGEPALDLVLQEDITAFLNSLAKTQILTIGLFVLLGVVGVSVALVLLQINLFGPMKNLQLVMSAVASGEFYSEVKGSRRKDELGSMTNALLYFIFIFKDNSRIKQSLDGVEKGIAIVDSSNKLIYLN
ncbi:MAG: hypothetical protein JKY67_15365 [Pseudomonadales bacterium]|nr:hypothetical protein [Pseudomonadales bacterium]